MLQHSSATDDFGYEQRHCAFRDTSHSLSSLPGIVSVDSAVEVIGVYSTWRAAGPALGGSFDVASVSGCCEANVLSKS